MSLLSSSYSDHKKNYRLSPELILGIGALIVGIAVFYLILAQDFTTEESVKTGSILIVSTGLLILAFLVSIAFRLRQIIRDFRTRQPGARLRLWLVAIFSLIAIVPSLLMAGFSSTLFEFGLQFWLSHHVRESLDTAHIVAERYVVEKKITIREDTEAMAYDLSVEFSKLNNPKHLTQYIQFQADARQLTSALLVREAKEAGPLVVLARLRTTAPVDTLIVADDLKRVKKGGVVLKAGLRGNDGRVEALVRLPDIPGESPFFLYTNLKVAPDVLLQVARTQHALSEYERIDLTRNRLQSRFMVALVACALLILTAAIWFALWIANRLAAPVSRFIATAQRVGAGDLKARVNLDKGPDELVSLEQAFNQMISDLSVKTGNLLEANEKLDNRRRFTEAVLSGVSAGILGLNIRGEITLCNPQAEKLLEKEGHLHGRNIEEIFPGLGEVMDCLLEGHAMQYPITIERYRGAQTFLVYMGAVGDQAKEGFVVSFDDRTEQITHQRRAAWSDVARRIAHEIKNPLTPIQLSAERLKRKYIKEISTDPEVFTACTDTIIRQVGDLKHMVDEFSLFARMPRPKYAQEPIGEVLQQLVLLLQTAHPDVQYHLDIPQELDALVCDRQQIEQALGNVLKNAFESCLAAKADPAVISITLAQSETLLEICISDNGIGIQKGMVQKVTEPYVTTRVRGTGLGLAIAKRIVEDHHGTITVKNRQEKGVMVTMQFQRQELERAYGS